MRVKDIAHDKAELELEIVQNERMQDDRRSHVRRLEQFIADEDVKQERRRAALRALNDPPAETGARRWLRSVL